MSRYAWRPEHRAFEEPPVVNHGADHVSIRVAVTAEARGRFSDRAPGDRRWRAVERMRHSRWRQYPLQSEVGERQRAPERGCHRKRMDGRIHVVHESRQGQLRRTGAAADTAHRLEDDDLASGPGEGD